MLTCSAGARVSVIASNCVSRGLYQYMTTLQYVMLVRRFAHQEELRKQVVFAYGIIISVVSIACSFAAYVLTQTNLVQCTLRDSL